MNYFKSTELAEKYGVSRRTITNWIEQTRQGRLNLELVEDSGRHYISNNPKNHLIMKGLVPLRRKFLNTLSLKHAQPIPEFYKLYSKAQILDIITNIETGREISREYNYIDEGAYFWDGYAQRLYEDKSPNMLNSTIKLLDLNLKYIESLLERYKYVNIVDVGVGNALPTKALTEHFLKTGKLKRYIGIDISPTMLEVAEHNLKKWFGEDVKFEGYCKNISFERFSEVIAEPPAKETANLVLVLGGTLGNFREPEDGIRTIMHSMQRSDLLAYTVALDSPTMRNRFSFPLTAEEPLPPQYKFIVDKLGIDPSFYDVEVGFNEQESARYLQIRLKHALNITFTMDGYEWLVSLNKDDKILLWRARHESATQVVNHFSNNRFNPLQVSKTPDNDYMLLLATLQREER
ncbi:MAG TPA: L-histidine N(alpha)-methyltransferase [Verrucomicrobiae bacterium]|nr:L-histidine N(alpha)-methyltransferase [Verrucomicrobiae bacterium]